MEVQSHDLPPNKFEYLDHTADIQLHAWGSSLEEAFEQCGMAMFGYITELDKIKIKKRLEIEVFASDLEGLLYKYLDELLYQFCAEPFLVCSKLQITELALKGDDWVLTCICYGEEFDIKKHPQGADIKAITYGSMQINQNPSQNYFDCFVIVDI